MRYRRPFTAEQRRDAAAVYRACRANYRLIGRRYRPRHAIERAALRRYRQAIKMFALESAKPDRRVDTDELNAAAVRILVTYSAYLELRLS